MNLGKISTGTQYRKIFLLFLMVAIVFSVFVLYFVIGKVDIILIPKQTEKDFEFSFTLEGKNKKSNYEQAIMPGQFIEKAFNQEIIITDGLENKETNTPAQGTITIYNESPDPKTFVANTQLLSDSGHTFLTTSAINIPARGNTTVGVIAKAKGSEYEIGPSHFIVTNLASLKSVIYAESTSKMTANSSSNKIINQDVLPLMLDKSETDLAAKLMKLLGTEIDPGYTFNQESIYIKIGALLPQNSGVKEKDGKLLMDLPEGDSYVTAEAFKIRIQGTAYAYAYEESVLKELTAAQANILLGDEYEYNGLANNKITVKFEKAIPEKGKSYFTAKSTAKVTYKLSPEAQDKKALIGFNKADIMNYYKQLDVLDNIEIRFDPQWIKNVPANQKHINIQIAEPPEKLKPIVQPPDEPTETEETETKSPEEPNQAS